jgi:hypothetical protein
MRLLLETAWHQYRPIGVGLVDARIGPGPLFCAGTIPGFVVKFPGVALRLWELRMPRTGWTPSVVPMVPYGADQTVYLVVDNFGRLGTAYRETDIERSDLE